MEVVILFLMLTRVLIALNGDESFLLDSNESLQIAVNFYESQDLVRIANMSPDNVTECNKIVKVAVASYWTTFFAPKYRKNSLYSI